MKITTIGIDLEKMYFKFTALTNMTGFFIKLQPCLIGLGMPTKNALLQEDVDGFFAFYKSQAGRWLLAWVVMDERIVACSIGTN